LRRNSRKIGFKIYLLTREGYWLSSSKGNST